MKKDRSTKKDVKWKDKTDEELKEIAKDLWAGRIFSDRHITDAPEMLKCVFLSLAFASRKDVEKMKKREVSFIYEYMDRAGPRAINGMPTFFSCRMLTKSETNKMFEYYGKFKELASGF